jgi:hypothetical protein
MGVSVIKIRWVIAIIVLLLGSYVALCVSGSGETLKVISGFVERCEILGGNSAELFSHATIKTEAGGYIISSLSDCVPGAEVNISIKRGILYFNTIYTAEKV